MDGMRLFHTCPVDNAELLAVMLGNHGIKAVEDRMHFHDLHATILHLLGLDHEKLTYTYAGREFRLTDVHGKVAKKILA